MRRPDAAVARTLHVPGYDREAQLAAGRASTLSIDRDVPGVFESELRWSGLVLDRLHMSP